jgi:hypothetical protein
MLNILSEGGVLHRKHFQKQHKALIYKYLHLKLAKDEISDNP